MTGKPKAFSRKKVLRELLGSAKFGGELGSPKGSPKPELPLTYQKRLPRQRRAFFFMPPDASIDTPSKLPR